MTLLNSKFDIVTNDPHPNARAGLMLVLDVAGAAGSPYGAGSVGGTPIPGTIGPGTIVVMDANGEAVPADNDNALTDAPSLLFIVVDGNIDYDGSFTNKLTCIHGGLEVVTEAFAADTYAPGDKLTCSNAGDAGKLRKAASGEQIYGIVGPAGLNTVDNTLNVFIPQGIAPAMP